MAFEAAKRSEEARRSVQGPQPGWPERGPRQTRQPGTALVPSLIGTACWTVGAVSNYPRPHQEHDLFSFWLDVAAAVSFATLAAASLRELRRAHAATRE